MDNTDRGSHYFHTPQGGDKVDKSKLTQVGRALNNRIIMDIVALLRTTKRNRQLIFATHNANFVVNGDADKVIVVGAPAAAETSSIDVDGAMETTAVRDAITAIMEGGKEAFELRGRKYAFLNLPEK